MAKMFNLARMTTATTGTGTLTLGSAVSGFLSFAQAGVSDGDYVDYAIKDGSNSEVGRGLYTSSGTTLTRNVKSSTNSNAAINLSGTAEVFVTAAAESLGTVGALMVKNLTVTASVAASALTVNIKTLAAGDPSATDEIVFAFRSATESSGVYVERTLRAASSIVISSGSTMGTTNSTAFALYLVMFDDAGTLRPGLINCLSGTSIYPLGAYGIASSTAEGGAGAADSAQVFYTGTAVSSKPYITLARLTWASGLATAGTWSAGPTRIEIVNNYGFRLPGDIVQRITSVYTANSSLTTAIPVDDTIPQITEGVQISSIAVTATSKANVLHASFTGSLDHNVSDYCSGAIFRTGQNDALRSGFVNVFASGYPVPLVLDYYEQVTTTSSDTLTVRCGPRTGGNVVRLNGTNTGRFFGGTMAATFVVEEIQA